MSTWPKCWRTAQNANVALPIVLAQIVIGCGFLKTSCVAKKTLHNVESSEEFPLRMMTRLVTCSTGGFLALIIRLTAWIYAIHLLHAWHIFYF